MLTIRKKLAEQATSKDKAEDTASKGSGLARKPSFRSQLLTAEANELGGVIPSILNNQPFITVFSCGVLIL